jgi:N-acetylmuramoyl-L-alanine amidase
MKKIVVVLGYAHGLNIAGKMAPDGSHREAVWSRARGAQIAEMLRACGFRVELSNPGDTDLLQGRIKNIDNIKVLPGQIKLYVPIHNNAAGMGDRWNTARGVEVWTKQGSDYADDFADLFFKAFRARFPAMHFRLNSSIPGAMDKEGNLYELKSSTAYSVMIEWLFQDNKEDIKLLKCTRTNKAFEDGVVDWIEMCELWAQKNVK